MSCKPLRTAKTNRSARRLPELASIERQKGPPQLGGPFFRSQFREVGSGLSLRSIRTIRGKFRLGDDLLINRPGQRSEEIDDRIHIFI